MGKAPAPASIAKDLLLKEPPKEVPTLPSATTSLGKVPAPAPRSEPAKVDPPKAVPTLPSATTSLGKLPTPAPIAKVEPAKEPAKVATDLPVFKAPEKPKISPNTAATAPKTISTIEPSTFDVPISIEKPNEPAKSEPAPPPPTAAPSDKDQPDVKVDAKTDTDVPAPPTSIATDILLPQQPPADTNAEPRKADVPIQVDMISQAEYDAIMKQYDQRPPSAAGPKGQPSKGSPTAGAGGAGAGSDGSAGASGEKGGGSSRKGKPYVPITPRTMAAPISGEPSWAAKQRAAQGTPFSTDPEIKKPENITGAQGSIQPPSDANADIVSKGNKAIVNMTPTDAAKAGTNVFKSNTVDVPVEILPPRELTIRPIRPDDKSAERDGADSLVAKDDKPAESLDRMRQLAGIKESVKTERQLLQESATNNINRIRSLAGLNK